MSNAVRDAVDADPPGGTTVLDPEAGHVTIINTYLVEPERADELITFLVEATRSTLRHVPGVPVGQLPRRTRQHTGRELRAVEEPRGDRGGAR